MKYIKLFENFLILEKSFHQIQEEDVFSSNYMNELRKSDYYNHEMSNYMHDNDIDEEEDLNIDEFEDYLLSILKNNYENFIDAINDTMNYNSGDIKIWRAISVDDNWLNKLKIGGMRLGVYWSWIENSAEAHWRGDFNNDVILEGVINEKYVNWIETIRANIHPNFDEEREINLFKNTPIKLISVVYNNEELPDTFFKNKIYKS